MDAPVTELFTEIQLENETLRAAICQRCGTKIYPPRLLKSHLQHHRAKDLLLEEEVKKLQLVMGRMRRK